MPSRREQKIRNEHAQAVRDAKGGPTPAGTPRLRKRERLAAEHAGELFPGAGAPPAPAGHGSTPTTAPAPRSRARGAVAAPGPGESGTADHSGPGGQVPVPGPAGAPGRGKLRGDAPGTAVAAATAVTSRSAEQRLQVLALLRGTPDGLTDAEIQERLSMPGDTERPRRCELTDKGHVKWSGRTRIAAGHREAKVWVACTSASPVSTA